MSATLLAPGSLSGASNEALAAAAPFKGLPAQVLKQIGDIAEMRRYLAGETVYAPGQFDGEEYFLVESGLLKAAYADDATGAMRVDQVGPGEFLGLVEAIAPDAGGVASRMTVSVEEDSSLIAFDARAFNALASKRPSLARNLMVYFAGALARAPFESAPDESSPQRLVFAALMEYIVRDAVSGLWRIPHMPKHRELAEKAGVEEHAAAEAVARLIRESVARRDYPGLVIDDMAQLTRLSS
ncbi:MAG TPA: cyclic nucleotide-binding domain-containing protein [Parvularculaceae bacterium]|nr:cyclic nucleotide-binding domain-containing protein [Parvularculaceae bacterium]